MSTKTKLNECIIASSKCKDGIFIVKNRDRAYYGRVELIHDIVDDVERLYYVDIDTGYMEGMYYNSKTEETGGILNTALSVDSDEKEKKKVIATQKRSVEGQKVLAMLTLGDYTKIIEAFKETLTISGHTFIVASSPTIGEQGNKFEAIRLKNIDEAENEEDNYLIEEGGIDFNLVSVRTNHADKLLNRKDNEDYEFNIGYTVGENYLSSSIRKTQVEDLLVSEEERLSYSVQDILDKLKIKNYEYDSPLNMHRDCFKASEEGNNVGLRTIGQIGLDISKGILIYDTLHGKSQILYTSNKLPKEYKAVLKLKVKNNDIEIKNYAYNEKVKTSKVYYVEGKIITADKLLRLS